MGLMSMNLGYSPSTRRLPKSIKDKQDSQPIPRRRTGSFTIKISAIEMIALTAINLSALDTRPLRNIILNGIVS